MISHSINRIKKARKHASFLIIVAVCIASLVYLAVYINFWLPVNFDYSSNSTSIETKLSVQSVPTVINGIIASTSVIVGFSGVFMGLMYREVNKKNEIAGEVVLAFSIIFILPIWNEFNAFRAFAIGGTYFLEYGFKSALSGFVSSVFTLFLVVLLVSKIMRSIAERQQKSV